MRNLEATSCVVLSQSSLLSESHCFCLDCDSGCVWVATSEGLCKISSENEVSLEFPLVEEGHVGRGQRVVGVECLCDLESVCVVLSGGDILMCNTTSMEVECVGSVSGGVVSVGWSPEQDVLVLVTGEGCLLLMTREFDPVSETPLHLHDFGEAKPVTVGWGKKETQFHGSLGKPRAEQLKPQPLHPTLPWDDGRPRISWRGDGEYFVCSAVDPETGCRKLRVWTRECVLHSTSEDVDGVEQALHWRPSGNLIASTQRKPHRHDVIFYERNGLRHGEFTLPCEKLAVQVREVQWNSDSTVLVVWLEELTSDQRAAFTKQEAREDGELAQPKTFVQLWSVSNYHWYLKQEIHLPGNREEPRPSLAGLLWDPLSPLRLHLITADGQYLCYSWRWSIAESRAHTPDNMATVAVIDGCRILLTPFRHTVVPPPMCAHELSLPSPVLQVAFAPPPRCNDFLALMASGQVAVFCHTQTGKEGDEGGKSGPKTGKEGDEGGKSGPKTGKEGDEGGKSGPKTGKEGDEGGKSGSKTGKEGDEGGKSGSKRAARPPELVGIASLAVEGPFCLHSVRQLLWWHPDRLVGVASRGGGVVSEVVLEFSILVDRENHSIEIEKCNTIPAPHPTLSLTTNPDSQTTIAQLTNGAVLRYTPGQLLPWQLSSGTELRFPFQACEQVAIVNFGGEEHVVGLDVFRRIFYLDADKLATGCTSFAVHNEFLVLTLDSHTCRFIPLHSDPRELPPVAADKPHPHDEGVRRVERGSRIVTAVTHDVKLVLQMPRGNLETVCPRALVLGSVRRSLDRLAFREAFLTMRTHRINLNLIHDHNPPRFLAHTKEFVQQLESVSYINLFLTELREEDVTEMMYPGGERGDRGGGWGEEGGSKVDHVCEAVREALIELGENRYLLSVITTHVKKTSPELEIVLEKIRQLRERPPLSRTDTGGQCEPPVTAEEALKYTLFLVDVNELFDVALGMYDFSLVLMVAEKSQKDPKEYLPFLNELRRLPTHYQRFRIDKHLQRYSKALRHISQCGSERFGECLSLVREHSLYHKALEIFPDQASPEYKAVAKAYGDYLTERGKHRETGIILTQAGFLHDALAAHEKAGCWRHVFALSCQLGFSETEHITLAQRIASSLKSQRQYAAAATVLLDYAHDVEEGFVALLEGSLWEEGLRIAYLHKRTDLIETHLKPTLLEAHQSQLVLMDSLHETFLHHSSRLEVVREEKRKKQTAILEGTYAADERDADLFSDTSSITGRSALSSVNTSLASKTSGRSSKNRRKAERKRHSLREGSAHEDVALLEALGEIADNVDKMQEEVASLLGLLAQYGFTSEAVSVQRRFSELLRTVRSKTPSIWQPLPPPPSLHPLLQFTGPDSTVNSILAAMATTKTTPPQDDAVASTRPKLRDNVNWTLDILT